MTVDSFRRVFASSIMPGATGSFVHLDHTRRQQGNGSNMSDENETGLGHGKGKRRAGVHLSREQILDATEQCLLEEGYDGSTIRRIAKQLGCAVGSIYRYFQDKRELLDAVVQRRFEPVATHAEVDTAMDRTVEMYVQIARKRPDLYRLMMWLVSVDHHNGSAALPKVIDRIVQAWADQMHDRTRAEKIWIQLHGGIMLGQSVDMILDQLQLRPIHQGVAANTSGSETLPDDDDQDQLTPDISIGGMVVLNTRESNR